MKRLFFFTILVTMGGSHFAVAQLPERLNLDFDDAADFNASDWLFVAPTPLGVVQADADATVSVADGNWNWSITDPNHVLVGVYPSLELTDSAVETTFNFAGEGGISIGFLNRFGAVPDPVDPANPPRAHGYCTLVSPATVTLIDFDFARDPENYIRVLAQSETPEGLFNGETTTVSFQTVDMVSATDPTKVVPTFDFWLGGTQIFDGVEDPNATWSSGYAGIDVWSVDPFAQATAETMSVNVDSFVIRGAIVPEPSGVALSGLACVGLLCMFRRSRVA